MKFDNMNVKSDYINNNRNEMAASSERFSMTSLFEGYHYLFS